MAQARMTAQLVYSTSLEVEVCAHCGAAFGVTTEFMDQRRKDKQTFYCPSGHGQSYTQSEADLLRGQLQRKESELARWRADWAEVEKGRKAAERQLKRVTKYGVCPYCQRNFAAVARHVKSKHPEQVEEAK